MQTITKLNQDAEMDAMMETLDKHHRLAADARCLLHNGGAGPNLSQLKRCDVMLREIAGLPPTVAREAELNAPAVVGSGAVVRRRWNDYAVWRQQHSPSVCERWTLTGHKLKAQSDKDAQSRLRRVFNGCGFTYMSLIAMPVGETPNAVREPSRTHDTQQPET